MRDHEFESRLIEWLDMPGEGDPYPPYADSYQADLRDTRFDALCSLYLEADEVRRAQIPALFAREESTRAYASIADWIASRERARNDLSNLIFYMRRVALSLTKTLAIARAFSTWFAQPDDHDASCVPESRTD